MQTPIRNSDVVGVRMVLCVCLNKHLADYAVVRDREITEEAHLHDGTSAMLCMLLSELVNW